MLRKFEGCLLGALAGDCLGQRFEAIDMPISKSSVRVSKFFKAIKEGNVDPGSLSYTDDTAMTKVLAHSLLVNRNVDADYLARKFSEEYRRDPDRGYGAHVCEVFHQVSKPTTDDVLRPAREQFNGTGSYGNGAAMRVSPVALFYHGKADEMMEAATDQSLPTHTHRNGYNGAVVQSAAVRQALLAGDECGTAEIPKLDTFLFLQNVKQLFTSFEKQGQHPSQELTYVAALDRVETLLKQSPPPSIAEVVEALGNNVTAPKSVPAAIYSFLRAQEPIEGISTENIFERTVHYAISLGGDTDTIGSMAGAICGAFVGRQNVPDYLIKVCEDNENMQKLAQQLFDAANEK